MKPIVVYVFALAVMVNGHTGVRVQLNAALEDHRENPYEYLLRTRRDGQICIPGSRKQLDCNTCICSSNGAVWGCTAAGCSYKPAVYSNGDSLSNPSHRTKRENQVQRNADLKSPSNSHLKRPLRAIRREKNGAGLGCTLMGWCPPEQHGL